jgi:hypothetical protein
MAHPPATAVLHLRLRDDAAVHHVRFDEQARHVALGHQRAPAVGESGRHRAAALDRVVDDAVDRELVDHLADHAVVEEHAVHRVAHAQERPLGEALERPLEVELEAAVGAAGGEPEVGRADEAPAPLGEQLVEAAEDRVAGHADEDQPVGLLGQRADPLRLLVGQLLGEIAEVAGARLAGAQGVGDPEVDRRVGQRVEDRGPAAVELEDARPGAVHLVRPREVLAQAVDVEALARDLLADADQLADLAFDVAAVVLELAAAGPALAVGGAGAGDVEREHPRAVHALPDLGPLDVRVAGVGQHGERRPRDAPHRVLAAAELYRDVGFDVAADVGAVAVVLGLVEQLVGDVAHRGLDRVDLGEHHRQVEATEDLGERAHDEDVGGLAARFRGRVQLLEPLAHQARALAVAASDDRLLVHGSLPRRRGGSRRTSRAGSRARRSSSSSPGTR